MRNHKNEHVPGTLVGQGEVGTQKTQESLKLAVVKLTTFQVTRLSL
jgi:hypothetical protein